MPAPPDPPEGARAAGSPGERMLRAGRGRGGGGVPCPDSHSPPRSPPGPGSAAVPAPALTARVSSQGSTSSWDVRSCGEVGASGGRAASGAERVGRMGQSLSRPPRTPQTRQRPAPLSHGSCGPSHHTRLPPPKTPAGEVTAALANQRPREGREPRTKGRAGGQEGYEAGEDGGGTSCD